jgi:hypothetical protein
MFLMLKKNWPGTFQRTIRGQDGVALRVVEFSPGVPVEITDQTEIDVLSKDVGPALLEVKVDKKGLPRPLDWVEPVERVSVTETISEVVPASAGRHKGRR